MSRPRKPSRSWQPSPKKCRQVERRYRNWAQSAQDLMEKRIDSWDQARLPFTRVERRAASTEYKYDEFVATFDGVD